MAKGPSLKTILEPAQEISVIREADVVVVGGGPGGHSAAVAAARNGADTVLIERYGILGGQATGGVVTIIPNLSGRDGVQEIVGLTQEWVDRMDKREATAYPPKEIWGNTDKALIKEWFDRSFFNVRIDRIVYSVLFDAEILKCVLNDMVEEAGVKTYLHSWGTKTIMEGNEAQGVIFESKSGRQAILAKVVIDGTADGDLFPSAGITYDTDIDPTIRIANLSLCYWIGGVDLQKATDFQNTNREKFQEMMRDLMSRGGHPGFMRTCLKNQESVVWKHPRYVSSSQIDVEELTRVEFEGRKKMLMSFDYFKENFPGFEKSFIALSAPQLGTRSSRRVHSEVILTETHANADTIWKDTIAIFPDVDRGEESMQHPSLHVPYRTLVPRGVENFLVACRAFGSDQVIQNFFNLIPHCIAFGEAAGTAAALCVKEGKKVRDVNIEELRDRLTKQDVPLPDERVAVV
jgi:hypothetical protein